MKFDFVAAKTALMRGLEVLYTSRPPAALLLQFVLWFYMRCLCEVNISLIYESLQTWKFCKTAFSSWQDCIS